MKLRHLEQYAGRFAMEENAFNTAIDFANRIDLSAHIAAMQARDDGDDLDVMPEVTKTEDGITCIPCIGTMTKYGSSIADGPSTIALRQCVRQAANDPMCVGILMRFDSPGGMVDGTEDLAADIANAGTKKPVWGFIDGMAAAAAYWAASQCTKIVALRAATVGSIGTYSALYDRSEQFAKAGLKALVVRAGEYKGAGTPGTQITQPQLDDQTRVINQLNDLFIARVAQGRKMSAEAARAVSDGRMHVGKNAKAMGLVDRIGSLEFAMDGLRTSIAKRKPAAQRTAPRNASAIPVTSIMELKSRFPQATAEWREKCHEQGLTLSAAAERWDDRLAESTTQVAPVRVAPADPKAAILAIVAEKVRAGLPRNKAFAQACSENRELHQAWIRGHTERHGR